MVDFYSMSTAKEEVNVLLSKLPDDCSFEDIQYHLYVIEKIRNGLDAAKSRGTVPQEEVEERFRKWLIE
jgi:hypothetical protein